MNEVEQLDRNIRVVMSRILESKDEELINNMAYTLDVF